MNVTDQQQDIAAKELETQLSDLLSIWTAIDSLSPNKIAYKLTRWQKNTATIIARYFSGCELDQFKRVSRNIMLDEENQDDDSLALTKERLEEYLQALLDTVWTRPHLVLNPPAEKQSELLGEQSLSISPETLPFSFEALLHPVISKSSYKLFCDHHYREAVLNSVTALFDYLRSLSGCQGDGDRLVGQAFSLENPILIFSEIVTESGQSDQKGFMQIFKGLFQGVRNPKAHSLEHDLTPLKTAQYLVFASLLARRLEEAKKVENKTHSNCVGATADSRVSR